MSGVDRIVLAARLNAGEREHAATLLAAVSSPSSLSSSIAGRSFSAGEVVFLFEGKGARESILTFLDVPAMPTALAPWLPLFEGPLHRAYEARSSEG